MSDSKPATESVRINERDIAIFSELFESRIMQRQHLAALHFGGSDAAAKERIGKKLLPAGYLAEVNPDRHPTEKAVYGLGRLGFEELKERGVIDHYEQLVNRRFVWERLEDRLKVRPLTIGHELAVMDVKAALTVAFRGVSNLRVCDFWTWPLLSAFNAGGIQGEARTKPDAYLRLGHAEEGDECLEEYFFLEVDRGTESLDTLIGKVADYHAYNASATFARFVGAAPAEAINFRVLFVFGRGSQDVEGAEERRNNFLHRVCQETPERFSVWATTFHEITRDPLGSIWRRPHDYSHALAGTPYDPVANAWRPRGGREAERDRLISERAVRRALLIPRGPIGQTEGEQMPMAQVLPFSVQLAIPTLEESSRVEQEESPRRSPAEVVRVMDLPPIDRREKEYRYLRHLLVRLSEAQGFGAKLCEPDADRVDVLLKRETVMVGCVIALVTTEDEEHTVLQACVEKGHTHIMVLSPDRERRNRIVKLLPTFPETMRIDVAAPEDIAALLDQIRRSPVTTESQVGTYKVRVTCLGVTPKEHEAKRAIVAEVIARSIARSKRP